MATYQIETESGVYEISTEDTQPQAQAEQPDKSIGVFGKVKESDYAKGERNVMGNLFDRPGAAVRSALMGRGYTAGAVNPSEVPTFQETALDKYYKGVSDIESRIPQGLGRQAFHGAATVGGIVPSAVGMAADIATSPADVLTGVIPGLKPVRDVGRAIRASKAGQVVADVATMPIEKMFTPTSEQLSKQSSKIIREGIEKAVRPSVIGKKTARSQDAYFKKAESAVIDVLDNKPNLELVDIDGNLVTGQNPRNLNEALQAVGQTKENIFETYAPMIKHASDAGAVVDGSTIASKLKAFAAQENVQLSNPQLSRYAEEVASRWDGKVVSLEVAEQTAKDFNAMLKQKYQQGKISGADISSAHVDDMVVRMLRGEIADKAGVRDLKRRYGALAELETDLAKRAIVSGRQNKVGLIESMASLETGADIAGAVAMSLATQNPAFLGLALRGIGAKAAGKIIKNINSPDANIARMFKNVEKLRKKMPTPNIQAQAELVVPRAGIVRGSTPQLAGHPERKMLPYKAEPIAPLQEGQQVAGEGFTMTPYSTKQGVAQAKDWYSKLQAQQGERVSQEAQQGILGQPQMPRGYAEELAKLKRQRGAVGRQSLEEKRKIEALAMKRATSAESFLKANPNATAEEYARKNFDDDFGNYVGGVIKEFEGKKKDILKSAKRFDNKIVDVRLGGSYGKNTPKPTSDIDLEFIYDGNPPDNLYHELAGLYEIGGGVADAGVIPKSQLISEFNEAKGKMGGQTANVIRSGGNIGTARSDEFVARERFDIPNLEKVSFGGSDRDVYDLGNGNVLKVAKTSRGLAQNQASVDYYAEDNGLIPKTIEVGKNYIVKERVEQPDKNTKEMVHKLSKSGFYGNQRSPEFFSKRDEFLAILEEHGYPSSDLANYDPLWNDLKAIRNWGTKEGKPILLDEGSLNGTFVDEYRGSKNMSDPDFRNAHWESRVAKKKFGDTDKKTMYGVVGAIGASTLAGPAEAKEYDFSDIPSDPKGMTKTFEGYRSSVYEDTKGKKTIGYGFNISDPYIRRLLQAHGWRSGKISKETADKVYDTLYNRAARDAAAWLGAEKFMKLPNEAKKILTDMSYNLGATKLAGFKETRKALLKNDFNKAADEMVDSDWYKQVKRRGAYLVEKMRGLATKRRTK